MGRQMRGVRFLDADKDTSWNLSSDDDVVLVHGKTGVSSVSVYLPDTPYIGESHLIYYYAGITTNIWVYPNQWGAKKVRFAGASNLPGQGWNIYSSSYPFGVVYHESPWYIESLHALSGGVKYQLYDGNTNFDDQGIITQSGDRVTFTTGPNAGQSRTVYSKSGNYLLLDGPNTGLTTGGGPYGYRVTYTQGLWWPIAK